MIGTLVAKDVKLFFRNRFFATVTGLALVLYLAIYFLLPLQTENSVGVAIHLEDPAASPEFRQRLTEDEDFTLFPSKDEMLAALEDTDDYFVGMSVPAAAARGESTTLQAFYAPDVPAEAKQVFHELLVFIANAVNPDLMARLSPIEETEFVLGHDLLGQPLAVRDRFLPLLLLAMVMTEVLGLGTLIVREIETGTARALLTGPLRLPTFLVAKIVTGLVLAMSQVVIVVLVTGKIVVSPLLLLTTLFLGSLLIVGMAFFIAAISRNNTSVLAWGTLTLILFLIPALSIMLPGLASGWMELVPSHYLADALHRVLNFQAGWADVARDLFLLAAAGPAALVIGGAVLRRRL
ncbi:MAG: ABC transporter permease [Caldilineaceae bacterium]|nr:ABC transporter permease [Caldilineaceae bacterium]